MESFGAYARSSSEIWSDPMWTKLQDWVRDLMNKKTRTGILEAQSAPLRSIYFLRLLYARIGEAYSYNTGKNGQVQWRGNVENILKNSGTKDQFTGTIGCGRKGITWIVETPEKRIFKSRVDGEWRTLLQRCRLTLKFMISKWWLTGSLLRWYESTDKPECAEILQVGRTDVFIDQRSNNTVQYSRQLMCEDTGISYEEPSQQFFFQFSLWSMPTCKGWIHIQVNMDAVIPNRDISISNVLSFRWRRKRILYFQTGAAACKKNEVRLDVP